MDVRLVIGRAGSGKTLLCLNEIKEKLASDTPGGQLIGRHIEPLAGQLIYLVPEQFNLEAEHTLITHCGADGLYNATVLTFKRIAHRVFAELGGRNRRYVNTTGKRICLAAVVEESKDSLTYHAGQAGSDGFIDDLYALFSEFKRFGHTPDSVATAAARARESEYGYGAKYWAKPETIPEVKPEAKPEAEYNAESGAGYRGEADRPASAHTGLAGKLAELAALYRRYCERIDADWLDTDDDLTRLAELIPRSRLIRESRVWIDGFSGFTAQEFAVIAALMAHAASVTICLCGEPPPTYIFTPTERTASEILSLASRAGIGVRRLYLRRDTEQPSALSYLERHIFRGGVKPYPYTDGAIRIVKCANRFAEAEAAAAEILALCRERGCRFKDIAVICPDLEAYAPVLGPVFGRAGIRCFIDIKREITDHPLPRLLLSLLSIVESGYAYEPVFSYLKTGLTDIGRGDADRLENFALARGIHGNLWKDGAIWRGLTGGQLDKIRRTFINPVDAFAAVTRDGCSPVTFCDALYAFMDACGARRRIQGIISRAAARPEGRALVSEWSQIWGYVIETLDQIAAFGEPDGRLPFSAYVRMFRCGIDGCRVGAIPPSADEVLVGSTGRTRCGKVKALLVLGANDGLFPAAPTAAGLLGDSDRVRLPELGFQIEMDSVASSFDLQFDVYRTLTLPDECLRVFWPAAGQGGRAQKPAQAVTMLERMFPGAEAGRGGNDAGALFAEKTAAAGAAFEGLVRELRGAMDARAAAARAAAGTAEAAEAGDAPVAALPARWRAVYNWLCPDRSAAARLSAISRSLYYRDPHVDLSDIYRRRLTSPDDISVTRLERYAACPFSYLAEYVVKALPRDVFRLEAPDIGIFVHRAAELAAIEITDGGLWDGLTFADASARSGEAVERLLAENPTSAFNANRRNRHMTGRIKATVAWGLYAAARHVTAGRYRPWKFEYKFNENTGAITLRGAIDRVDVARADAGGYVRVIDFKTGRRELEMSDIVYGLAFQLPVYLDVALRTASASPELGGTFLPGGLFYLEMRQPFLNAGDAAAGFRGGKNPATAETIDRELLNRMMMKGFVVGDERSFADCYENDIAARSKSEIVKGVTFKRDGAYYGRVFAPSADDFRLISRAVSGNINDLCGNLRDGRFDVSPYKKKDYTPCVYCAYRGACGLALVEPSAAFRHIPHRSNKKLLEALRDAHSAHDAHEHS